jgi:putative phage-type endonuclease
VAVIPALAQELSNVGVGGSEIAAACGFSKYKSRFELWLEKTGRRPPFAGNVHTRLGQLCEGRARQLYANATGESVEIPACSVFHPEIGWARCTPDGRWVSDPRHKVQIKCVGYYVGRNWHFARPVEVIAQCQWEMFVDDGHTDDLAVLSGSDMLEWERFLFGFLVDPQELLDRATMEIYPIHRSDSDIATLIDGARKFMHFVETDTQPPVDHSAGCSDFFNEKRPGGHVDLDPADDILAAVEEFRDAYTEDRLITKRLAKAKNAVRELLASAKATRIKTQSGPVTWTTNHQLRAPKSWGSDDIEEG